MRRAYVFLLSAFFVGCGEDVPGRDRYACPASPLDNAAGARVFVVQPRIAPERFETYEAYQTHLVKLARSRVAPCLADKRPNVIVFPENVGLPAAFIGSRGEAARASTSSFAAFLALGGQYAKPIQFYKTQWPDTALATQIELGITDTVWRAFDETNQLIARETGAFVIASTNVSGLIEKSEDPLEIEAIADPDLSNVSYVYVARDPAVYNSAFVYGPDGSIVARRNKPYLISSEEQDLSLAKGSLREATPVPLGPLKAGIFTSKDAWMPDMVDRLAALGADVFIQPEAFSGWTIPENPSEPNAWAPDIVSQSALAAVRKHSAYRYGVIAHITGNLFDLPFDGQSIILQDPTPGEVTRAYVGQNEEGGVLAVAPWVTADPIENEATLSMEARRTKLRATGQELLPRGTRANQYVETVIAADLDPAAPLPVGGTGAAGALGASRALSSAGEAEQSHPAIAWNATSPVVVAYQEGPRGATRVYVTTSEDQGKSFTTPRSVSPANKTQITPAVLVTGTYVYVAWQERDSVGARIGCAMSVDRGKTFGLPTYLPSPGAAPDAWLPAFASANGQVFVTYVDGSSGSERIIVARAPEGTVDFTGSPVEVNPAQMAGSVRNNQWAPAIAANDNQIAVAWVDFRQGNWDVYLSRSTNGGLTFPAPIRIDDGTEAFERLHDDPTLLFLPEVDPPTLAVGWSDVRLREKNASPRISLVAGTVIGQSRRFGPIDGSAVFPRLAPLGPGKLAVVWQDNRTLGNDVYLSTSIDGGANFGDEKRIDDGGEGPSQQTAPVIAGDGLGSVIVAWEDSRSGRARIRYVVGKP